MTEGTNYRPIGSIQQKTEYEWMPGTASNLDRTSQVAQEVAQEVLTSSSYHNSYYGDYVNLQKDVEDFAARQPEAAQFVPPSLLERVKDHFQAGLLKLKERISTLWLQIFPAKIKSETLTNSANIKSGVPDLTGRVTFNNGRVIGEGNFGVVVQGFYKGKEVVVKDLKVASTNNINAAQKEIAIGSLFSHPNVLRLEGVDSRNGVPCPVLEYCRGGDLAAHLLNVNNTVTIADALKLLNGTAEGLSYIHEKGIIHRDIAARNILLTDKENYQPKIADFGLATAESEINQLKTGPIRWCAPEVLRNQQFSKKSDVWAFGITMVEILTRNQPFPGLSNDEVRNGILENQLNPLDSLKLDYVPIQLQMLAAKCFKTNPDDRPDMSEIAHELTKLLGPPESAMKLLNIDDTNAKLEFTTHAQGVKKWKIEVGDQKYEVKDFGDKPYNGLTKEQFSVRKDYLLEAIKGAASDFKIKKIELQFNKQLENLDESNEKALLEDGKKLLTQLANDLAHVLNISLKDLQKIEQKHIIEKGRPTVLNLFTIEGKQFFSMQTPQLDKQGKIYPSSMRNKEGLSNFVSASFGSVEKGSLFEGFRHSSPTPIAIQDRAKRHQVASKNVLQFIENAANKLKANEGNSEEKPLELPLRVMMLLTGKVGDELIRNRKYLIGKWKGESESMQLKESVAAFKKFDGKTININGVWVKPNIEMMNYGANKMARMRGDIPLQDRINEKGFMKFSQEVAEKVKNLDLNESAENDLRTLYEEARKAYTGKEYKKKDTIIKLQANIILANHLMGNVVDFFCKSAEDRTGAVNEYIEAMLVFKEVNGRFPTSSSEDQSKLKEYFAKMEQYSTSQDNTLYNSGAWGKQAFNKVERGFGELAKSIFKKTKPSELAAG